MYAEWLRANNYMPADGVKFPRAQMHPPLRQASAPSSPTVTAVAKAAAKKQKLSPLSPMVSSSRPLTSATAVNGNTANNAVKTESPTSSVSSMPPLPASMASHAPASPGEEISPFSADERSAAYEVAELCKRLGAQPPQYQVTQDPQHQVSKQAFETNPSYSLLPASSIIDHLLTRDGQYQGFWSGYAEFSQEPFGPLAQLPPCSVEGVLGKRTAKEKIAELLVPHLIAAWDARQARMRNFMRREPVTANANATVGGVEL